MVRVRLPSVRWLLAPISEMLPGWVWYTSTHCRFLGSYRVEATTTSVTRLIPEWLLKFNVAWNPEEIVRLFLVGKIINENTFVRMSTACSRTTLAHSRNWDSQLDPVSLALARWQNSFVVWYRCSSLERSNNIFPGTTESKNKQQTSHLTII